MDKYIIGYDMHKHCSRLRYSEPSRSATGATPYPACSWGDAAFSKILHVVEHDQGDFFNTLTLCFDFCIELAMIIVSKSSDPFSPPGRDGR